MLSNRYFSVFCVFLCAVCAGSASADNAAVKKAIQAQYDKGDKAMLAENADAYARICTPDATFLAPRHKPETLKELKSHIGPNPDPDSIVVSDRHTIQKLKLDKTGVMAEVDAEEITSGTTGPEGKKHSWSVISHNHDLWIKQHQVWLLKKSVLKKGSVFRQDGKVIPIDDETP